MFDKIIVEEFMSQKFKWVHLNDSLEEVLKLFKTEIDVILVINDNNDYEGILTKRMILRSGLSYKDTKVGELAAFAPKIDSSTTVQEAARLMLEYDVMNLPVFDNNNLVGVVDSEKVLSVVAKKKFGKRKVKDIMSENTIVVTPKDKVSWILRIFRDSHISRLPVVEDGFIKGIVTLHDILYKLIFPQNMDTFAVFFNENESMLDTYVENIMSYPVISSNFQSNIKDVIDQMVDYKVNGIIIIDNYNKLIGMITKRDILEHLYEEKIEFTYSNIQINSKIKNINKKELLDYISDFIKKYEKKLGKVSINIYLSEQKKKSDEKHLTFARCRIRTDYGRFAVSAEGWGHYESIRNVMLNFEKQINKKLSQELKLKQKLQNKFMDYVEIESLS